MIRQKLITGLLAMMVLAIAPVWAQRPVINPDGVVNAASYVQAPKAGHALAPGSIASLFGRNLATATASADTLPLPTILGGTSVTVQGRPAHLLYVSPGQINFQIPERTTFSYPLDDYAKVAVVVTTPAGASEPVMIDMFIAAPGVFTLDGSGCGRGAVLNVKADGTVSVNSPSNSAAPGDYLEIFGTGLGPYLAQPDLFHDGEGAPYLPGKFGGGPVLNDVAVPGQFVTFAGRAPGLVGVNQVNFQVSADVTGGCAVPLRLGGAGMSSQPVLVSIHRGGGQCADPPVESFGDIVWQKEVVANASPLGETDTFVASFPASPGRRAPPAEGSDNPMLGGDSYRFGLYTAPQAPSCPIPGYQNLDIGTLSLRPPGQEPIRIAAAGDSAELSYRATLSTGSIRAGSFSVSAAGGNGVAPFQSNVQIGSGIQITSQFPVGTQVRSDRPLTVTWTGGEPGSVVRVRLISHGALQQDTYIEAQVPAPEGRFTFNPLSNPRVLPLLFLPNLEIVVDVFPDPSQVPSFSAPGLTLGGRHTWLYRYRFPGLNRGS